LIFFNEIFTVYAASDGEYEKLKLKILGDTGPEWVPMTP
jgi:hypothetical protein